MHKSSPWWLSLGISLAITVGGWIASAASLSTKTADMQERQLKLEARYEREVVPRSEHEARNKGLDNQIQRLEVRLDAMQILLENISREVTYTNSRRNNNK